ncbi:uncharacterized protein LAESUDRAFT_667987 [Laetiporus sulphureus 93-53]|uniref:Helitron helicase-like domain-containing protein n=1 Tax=Laetiporus sulphureus 93-53 TaxID=1314785 RepID=A0A165AQ51_9APHY|nr:uncharacterized protein LAESUDRAFT_667987 [Laetiporus sulphureus 93-53]KZS99437.1 hypothetical protein LAESUDRAFT_667987 [Laetiporus sulphureus 93-53]
MKKLFQIRVTNRERQVESKMGVLGHVKSYFGVVESQGRGTLHLHLFVWLQGAPSADEIIEALGHEDFRERI